MGCQIFLYGSKGMVFSSNYAKDLIAMPKTKNCTAPEVDLTHIPIFGVFPVSEEKGIIRNIQIKRV